MRATGERQSATGDGQTKVAAFGGRESVRQALATVAPVARHTFTR
jgi:hypothetical protein